MALSTRLKIGLVLDTSLDPFDGVQQYVIQLGQWLSQQGHEVHYLVGETRTRDLPNLHSLARNISVTFNGNRTTIPLFASGRKLRSFIERQKYDVLHVQTPHHPFMAQRLILAAGPETAVVGTFHVLPYGKLARFGNHLLGIWLKPSLKRFDKMLAVSSVAAEFCQQSFKVDATVIPNMIDYKLFHDARPLDGFKNGAITILFLGRLVERKGCQVLLEAVAQIASDKTLPEFRVVICGKGHLDKQLRKFVADNNLRGIVTFTGFVSEADKLRYYASADIAVFPSSSGESFGIVLLEAMASGQAAVLAGDNPGYRSVMSPQPNLLFEPKNVPELALKIKRYLKDEIQRLSVASWGEAYAAQFDVDIIGQKILAVYKQALRKRRIQ
jgi:phosphatidylinositol alpha-mannosyltransferase